MDNNLTISAYLIDKNVVKQTDFSNPIAVRKEMVQNPEESLWIHADEPEDIFLLQGVFGLHPLSVEAVTHQNQPSKIEEYGASINCVNTPFPIFSSFPTHALASFLCLLAEDLLDLRM